MKVIIGILKAIGVLLSIVVSVIVFAVTSATICLWSVSDAMSPDSIKDIIKSIDISVGGAGEANLSASESGIMAELTLKDSSTVLVPLEGESDPLGGFNLDEILNSPEVKEMLDGLREQGVDVDALVTVVKDDVIGVIVSDFAKGLTEYIVDGTTDIVIDADYIIGIAENVKPKIEEIFGEEIPADVWNELKTTVTESSEEIIGALPSYEEIKEELESSMEEVIPGGFETVNAALDFIFSELVIIIPIGILLALALLIAIFRASPFRWLCWTAVPMIISGLLFLAVSLFGSVLTGAMIPPVERINIAPIIGVLFSSLTFNSALFIGISVIFFIAYGILCGVAKKIKAKRAAKKAEKKALAASASELSVEGVISEQEITADSSVQ